jgi:hypothetical protein
MGFMVVTIVSVVLLGVTSPRLEKKTVAMRVPEPDTRRPPTDPRPAEPETKHYESAPSWGEIVREAVHQSIPFVFSVGNLWVAWRARKKWKMIEE